MLHNQDRKSKGDHSRAGNSPELFSRKKQCELAAQGLSRFPPIILPGSPKGPPAPFSLEVKGKVDLAFPCTALLAPFPNRLSS
jgi:hypothetical protein